VDLLKYFRNQRVVDVVSAKMRVAVGGEHFEYAVAELEYRYIKGSAAEVVNRNQGLVATVDAVGQRCRGRFVYDPQNLESRQVACVFCSLSLRVVEIGGHGDHRLGDLFSKVGGCALL